MAKWDPYSLKKPCKNCPFLKDREAAINLAPGRVKGIIDGLVNGPDTGFSCHKSVYSKLSGHWVDDPDSEDGERYQQSGNEKQCAGSLIVMQKLGKETQLMQVMRRLGQYNPDDFKTYHDLVLDGEDLN